VRAVAAGLATRGFGKDDVFAHYAPNLPEYPIAFHGVATVGGVNTTVNPLFTPDELAAQLRDSDARLLVTVPPLLEKAAAAAERADVYGMTGTGPATHAVPDELAGRMPGSVGLAIPNTGVPHRRPRDRRGGAGRRAGRAPRPQARR
jgi:acyl-coenzyme A synthetase/AMP-(fatty) acid ligase